MRTLKDIKDRRPELAEREDIKELAESVDTFLSLEVLAQSEGGKILIANLKKDVLLALERIAENYKTLSHEELVAYAADLKSKIDLVRLLVRSKKKKGDLLNLLNDILDE